VWLTGCATSTPAQTATAWALIAQQAAFYGTAVDLQQHPAHRPEFNVALAALRRLEADPSATAGSLVEALQGLPGQFDGPQGSLAILGVVTVYDAALASLPIESAPEVRRYAGAIADGIWAALNTFPSELKAIPPVTRTLPSRP
jgi:hypothetical protein